MNHPKEASKFNQNPERARWHDQALWHVRNKRDTAAQTIPEWEQLREHAALIKDNVLANLDDYLVQFEEKAQANGVHVHWARNGHEHNKIIHQILHKKNVEKLVKSKSMLTEECHLNPYLEGKGIEVVDTDLGERIVQFAKEPPSHIVMPAIHKKKEEVGAIFHQHLGADPDNFDPQYLTETARQHLRANFLSADAALTGVNFGIAETGGIVVCTNEGNADLGVNLAPLHIASMGIEKLIPRAADLGIFLRLLARSATGQPVTTYSSHYHGPRPGSEMHIVIVDNGRSEHLGWEDFRRALRCIRCGACMNTCPVYRRSGGHSYGYTVPGPIGSILSPGRDLSKYSSLPFASSLCGSCSDVCPVKIDIHEQLYKWRQVVTKKGKLGFFKRQSMRLMGLILGKPGLYNRAAKMGLWALKKLPRTIVYNKLNVWGKQRELPEPPQETFKKWYRKNHQL